MMDDRELPAGEFAAFKRRIMAEGQPVGSARLEGMLVDCSHLLERSGRLRVVRTRKTGDPARMIEVRCQPVTWPPAVEALAAEIEQVWLDELRLPSFEAHLLTRTPEAVVLDFVTAAPERDYTVYVTGAIVVDLQPPPARAKERPRPGER